MTCSQGYKVVLRYLDDIIVTVTTLEEHNRNVHALFKKIAVWISCPKGEVFVREEGDQVSENLISKDGRRPDPEKIHAIVEMPPPKDKKQLKSFFRLLFQRCDP